MDDLASCLPVSFFLSPPDLCKEEFEEKVKLNCTFHMWQYNCVKRQSETLKVQQVNLYYAISHFNFLEKRLTGEYFFPLEQNLDTKKTGSQNLLIFPLTRLLG